MKIKPKKIYLPHLNYTVHVRHFKPHPSGDSNAKAWAEHIDSRSAAIYISPRDTPCGIAHELIHVLQFIAADRNIDFIHEQEHFGYMMQYLMGKTLGYEWV
jgi:hypothetical protein